MNTCTYIIPAFTRLLTARAIPAAQHGDYRKWLRFYLDFCGKYGHASHARESLRPFMEKLRAKGQNETRRAQAQHAVLLYLDIADADGESHRAHG